MKIRQPNATLTLAYEALRAQATGGVPTSTPRGLALFLAAGCPAWMHAWQPLAAADRTTSAVIYQVQQQPAAVGGEVVQVLTEMALGRQRRWTS